MTTTTTEPATDWRDHNDRDAHQDRLATEPAAGRDQWGRQGAPLRGRLPTSLRRTKDDSHDHDGR